MIYCKHLPKLSIAVTKATCKSSLELEFHMYPLIHVHVTNNFIDIAVYSVL